MASEEPVAISLIQPMKAPFIVLFVPHPSQYYLRSITAFIITYDIVVPTAISDSSVRASTRNASSEGLLVGIELDTRCGLGIGLRRRE
jgi:hypothetical protein